MSSTQTINEPATKTPTAATVDLKLEVVVLPVSDVDRSKRFYENLGWRMDGDFTNGDAFHAVQMTPPGSPCSIHFGKGITTGRAGLCEESVSRRVRHEGGTQELLARGAEVSEPFISPASGANQSRAPIPTAARTLPMRHSAIRTATVSCSRKSRLGYPGEDSAAWMSRI
jgi:catechol 2,3-dioxygenase-like lactoylglutathione lyase family enzyme